MSHWRRKRFGEMSAELYGLRLREALGRVGPVDDIPPGLDVVGLHVQVLQVERVLPDVEQNDRRGADGEVVLVVIELLDDQLLAERLPGQRRPAVALDRGRGGG